mmetsp:Transcript_18265/g.42914  ORF Transcript_18265/g.42914 Transcript_18265/m.42914 type:complete len:303 (-) Transcript_18265:100-1008(-)
MSGTQVASTLGVSGCSSCCECGHLLLNPLHLGKDGGLLGNECVVSRLLRVVCGSGTVGHRLSGRVQGILRLRISDCSIVRSLRLCLGCSRSADISRCRRHSLYCSIVDNLGTSLCGLSVADRDLGVHGGSDVPWRRRIDGRLVVQGGGSSGLGSLVRSLGNSQIAVGGRESRLFARDVRLSIVQCSQGGGLCCSVVVRHGKCLSGEEVLGVFDHSRSVHECLLFGNFDIIGRKERCVVCFAGLCCSKLSLKLVGISFKRKCWIHRHIRNGGESSSRFDVSLQPAGHRSKSHPRKVWQLGTQG